MPIECDATGRKLPQQDRSINVGVKQMGARSAGNPHAACDVEGTGNVVRSSGLPARQSSTLPVGAGGGRPPPATRWARRNPRPYRARTRAARRPGPATTLMAETDPELACLVLQAGTDRFICFEIFATGGWALNRSFAAR